MLTDVQATVLDPLGDQPVLLFGSVTAIAKAAEAKARREAITRISMDVEQKLEGLGCKKATTRSRLKLGAQKKECLAIKVGNVGVQMLKARKKR